MATDKYEYSNTERQKLRAKGEGESVGCTMKGAAKVSQGKDGMV